MDKIFIKHPNMPVSLMVTISIRDTMTDTKQEVIGPQIRPPNVMMTSLGSYFRKKHDGYPAGSNGYIGDGAQHGS